MLELDFPLLSDTDKKVAKSYGILIGNRFSKRVTIYVDKAGKIAHIETKVKIAEAGKQVVDRLKALKVELKEAADQKESGEKSEDASKKN